MLKTHRNTIGNLMITLLFVGGCIFLLTGSWDASEAEEAKGCCGGGGAALTSFAANNGGDFGSDIPMDAEVTGGCCGGEGKVIPSSSNSACTCLSEAGTSCGSSCDNGTCSGAENTVCGGSSCSPSKNECECDGERCPNDTSSSVCTSNC